MHRRQQSAYRLPGWRRGKMFAESQDQQLLESTSRRFIEAHYPMDRVRELAVEPSAFEPSVWREAAKLGWTTFLVPDGAGGGSVSGNGLADLLIVASLFGYHATPGPLLGTNLVAAAIGRWGSAAQQAEILAQLLDGDTVAAWGELSSLSATNSGHHVVLNGRVRRVEGATDASWLLLAAGDGSVNTHYLVPTHAPGVEFEALGSIDLTRRFQNVTLRDVTLPAEAIVGEPGAAGSQGETLLDLAVILGVGSIAGALERTFEMTMEWLATRYSFGRPLNSYQELKHRMADTRTYLEAIEAVAARAALEVGSDTQGGRAWASAAMAFAGRYGLDSIQDCVQLHGGIGVTYDHDLHVYLRRATIEANLHGTWSDFAQRLGKLVAIREGVLL
jgi:alkylation response protein AidB-like acyl-CoA dehydrogenase